VEPDVSRWIVSARQDLLWFHGAALAGIALLAVLAAAPPIEAHAGLFQPALVAVILWGVFFDGTHVVGTWARSYWAPDAASRVALPARWWWAILALGPAFAFDEDAFGHFLVGAYVWAFYHLVRQHWGFVALYRRRAGHAAGPAWLDEALLWTGAASPYLRYALSERYAHSGLPALLPAAAVAALRPVLDLAVLTAVAVLAAVWAGAWRSGRLRPGPQHLLIAVVTVLHGAVFAMLSDPLLITAALTIVHNLQYHRIVWHYEAGRGRRPLGGAVPYLATGVAFGACWYGARVAGAFAAGPSLAGRLLLGLGWGIALHHYVVDARIWRVRRHPAAAAALAGAGALLDRPRDAGIRSAEGVRPQRRRTPCFSSRPGSEHLRS
jgi:hypothetical protein